MDCGFCNLQICRISHVKSPQNGALHPPTFRRFQPRTKRLLPANFPCHWLAALGLRLLALVAAPALFFCLVELVLRLAGFGYPTAFLLPASLNGQKIFVQNNRFSWRFFRPALARLPWLISIPQAKRPIRCGFLSSANPQPKAFHNPCTVCTDVAGDVEPAVSGRAF